MVPFDPTIGEFRIHYAGFFDPGFGYGSGEINGTRAVLEVRSHEVPFILEDGQVVASLVFEKLLERPRVLYGEGIGSSYQRQGLKLSKHFKRPCMSSTCQKQFDVVGVGLNATDTMLVRPALPRVTAAKFRSTASSTRSADRSPARWSPAPGSVCARNISARSATTSAAAFRWKACAAPASISTMCSSA